MNQYINIKWQEGTVLEVGSNGTQVQDVIEILLDRLREFNAGSLSCRENSLAITKLEEAHMWLDERTRDRTVRNVEGTMNQ